MKGVERDKKGNLRAEKDSLIDKTGRAVWRTRERRREGGGVKECRNKYYGAQLHTLLHMKRAATISVVKMVRRRYHNSVPPGGDHTVVNNVKHSREGGVSEPQERRDREKNVSTVPEGGGNLFLEKRPARIYQLQRGTDRHQEKGGVEGKKRRRRENSP